MNQIKQMWYNRNNFVDNEEYAIKVLNRFEIDKYHFSYDKYGEMSLLVEKNLKKYKIIVDIEQQRMCIYRCEVHNNFAKHTKENMVLKKYFEDDCIWDSIKWIAKDCKL